MKVSERSPDLVLNDTKDATRTRIWFEDGDHVVIKADNVSDDMPLLYSSVVLTLEEFDAIAEKRNSLKKDEKKN